MSKKEQSIIIDGRMMRLEILMKLPLKISSKQRIKKTDLAVKMRMGRL